jgi:hypothetical protein
MAERELSDEPVLSPWVVKALRRRPKLIDSKMREEVLANLEQNISHRRRPDVMAERLARVGLGSAKDAAEPAARSALEDKLAEENGRFLKRL